MKVEDIQWIKISRIVEYIWHTLESSHKSWNIMNIGTIKAISYVECYQYGKSSTQTTTSTCPTMWIEVLRLNIVVHHLITSHWCILLIDTRSPIDNEMGIKVLECNLTSVNKCVEVKHLRGSINQGTLMYSQELSMERAHATDDYKSQGTQMSLESYPRINDLKLMGWNPLEGEN